MSIDNEDLKHIAPQLAETIQGCYIFVGFSLDDPVNHPPAPEVEDES